VAHFHQEPLDNLCKAIPKKLGERWPRGGCLCEQPCFLEKCNNYCHLSSAEHSVSSSKAGDKGREWNITTCYRQVALLFVLERQRYFIFAIETAITLTGKTPIQASWQLQTTSIDPEALHITHNLTPYSDLLIFWASFKKKVALVYPLVSVPTSHFYTPFL
jgi:hypothetical protein